MIIKEYGGGILRSLFFLSYMIDAADREKIEASRNELHNLLDKPQLQGIPVSMVNFTLYDFILPIFVIFELIHFLVLFFHPHALKVTLLWLLQKL